MDYSTWYVDRLGDLRCDAVHHDGTNHYLYRAYKENVSEAQIDRLKEKLYSGTATRADVTRDKAPGRRDREGLRLAVSARPGSGARKIGGKRYVC